VTASEFRGGRSPLEECCEGRARFRAAGAFYRPASRVVRDLGVLAAAVYRERVGRLRVLDGMAGSGVRALRYWLESGAQFVLAGDCNPEVLPLLEENLAAAIAAGAARATCADANQLLYEAFAGRDYFDAIDLDGFGTPMPYVPMALRAARWEGLLYLTCTDGRAGTGNLPNKALQAYGAYTRSHPAAHEQALRVAIGAVQQQAAALERGVVPVFAYFTGATYRILVRVVPRVQLDSRSYGFLGYCRRCGNYTPLSWRKLGHPCPTDGQSLALSGPLWLGALHDAGWLEAMAELARRWDWPQRAALLAVMAAESALPPYYVPVGEIGKRGRTDLPKRDELLQALRDRGYRATAVHLDAQAIKTDAAMEICVETARSLSARRP